MRRSTRTGLVLAALVWTGVVAAVGPPAATVSARTYTLDFGAGTLAVPVEFGQAPLTSADGSVFLAGQMIDTTITDTYAGLPFSVTVRAPFTDPTWDGRLSEAEVAGVTETVLPVTVDGVDRMTVRVLDRTAPATEPSAPMVGYAQADIAAEVDGKIYWITASIAPGADGVEQADLIARSLHFN